MERRNSTSDIEQRLRSDRSKSGAERLVEYIGTDKKRLKDLVKCFFSDDERLSELAAFPIGKYFVVHQEMLSPYFNVMIRRLKESGHHDAVYRCILRSFIDADIPEKYVGELVDIGMSFITNASNAVAIRAFSIKMITNICMHYPELKNEFLLILGEIGQYPQEPAIKATLRYAYKKLNK